MIKSKKLPIYMISFLSLVAIPLTIVGSTYAAWAVTDNAGDFSVNITPYAPGKKRITYYLPKASGSGFEEAFLNVETGSNLYNSLSSYTTNINGFSFVRWHTSSSNFRNDASTNDVVSNNYVVNDDVTVYAKYVKTNVAYYWDNNTSEGNYVYASTSNLAINNTIMYYGDQIYSLDGVEGSSISLAASDGNNSIVSGVYSLTKNSNNWSVKRVINLNANNLMSNNTCWWVNGAKTFVYCFGASDNTTSWTGQLSFSNNIATFEVDLKYTKFIAVRTPTNKTSGTFDDHYNQTVDVGLMWTGKGSEKYSSSHNTLWLETEVTNNNNKFSWW